MSEEPLDPLPPELRAAFVEKGFTNLTAIQAAVLAEGAEDRDLRITSQTGSGKTIAIGLVLRALAVTPAPAGPKSAARPRALVIAPTRELGRQVEEELGWLYGPLGAKVAAVTGGASYRDEHRALASGPAIVVATPGRLIDHLEHGSIDPSNVAAVVLDEADRMLDMGFAEPLAHILSKVPEGRRTHLVSATFPPEVRRLADRVQREPLHVEGTRLGAANADIEHLLVLCDGRERFDVLVNLLLWHGDARTLVFARTRADVSELAGMLDEAGFGALAISGELAQNERTRALAAFRRGTLRVLVATDVAARGIDVSDVALVVHMDPPTNPDAYTHRAGRTGRAGKKGTSAVLVSPRDLLRAQRVVSRANVRWRIVPAPTPSAVRAREDDRIVERLAGEDGEIDARSLSLAERVAGRTDPTRALARLLSSSGLSAGPTPRDIKVLLPPSERRDAPPPRARAPLGPRAPVTELPPPPEDRFVPFQISLGARQGVEPRRLLAMMCRRGEIESRDVGAIRIGEASSIIEVREHVAEHFRELAMRPDPRDPAVKVRPALTGRGARAEGPREPHAAGVAEKRFPRARTFEGPGGDLPKRARGEGPPGRFPPAPRVPREPRERRSR